MAVVTPTNHELITVRIPRRLADEVREIATRDEETQAATLRRLLKVGLATERRSSGAAR
jgi:hypothetical protein